jgi:hypothetical protein
MNENPQSNEPLSRHDERVRRHEERRALRGGGEWIVGTILLVLGVVLLAQTFNIVFLSNWWALLIMIPAVASFVASWRLAQDAGGQFNRRSRSAFIIGSVLALASLIFLFNINTSIGGPVLLILAGIALFANALLP